ncbi:hypothetical protein Z517_02512 [Fonsecaea pedrosoi CBS 271.37]|uniref:Tautomerase cis-CaaD-like domain-containing protein n=1 Tax=Fonsecaea pedrosoi CBS 271.37 TaxID=1442368 RepID=A0A0D2F9E5_9EURO|nr:uncharacterized protein Z517_02512 [Fonsecaea pedrosoi CBS 271.37]KIW83267.1 hypothetical protein Z517_02512 [Fonsecaea pedrosoi CBS 271.37]
MREINVSFDTATLSSSPNFGYTWPFCFPFHLPSLSVSVCVWYANYPRSWFLVLICFLLHEIQHTYPLTRAQKHRFAQAVTRLHSTTFLTPSLFVNVSFHRLSAESTSISNFKSNPLSSESSASDANGASANTNANDNEDDEENTYFLAGEPVAHNRAGPNRILAMVRTSASRTKAVFDDLAEKIEAEWYAVVGSDATGSGDKATATAKKMHFIVFYPMIAARENGVTIPDAGSESTWLRSNMPFFKTQAHEHDDDNFRKMLDEIERRDDLRKLIE